MPVSSKLWRIVPSNSPTVGKFWTPEKPIVEDFRVAIGCDEQGWWFDANFLGRWGLPGAAAQAAAFARWILEPPPSDRYEKQFDLLRSAEWRGAIPEGPNPSTFTNRRLDLDVLLGREDIEGPEYLLLCPMGEGSPGFTVSSEPLDRRRLESAAAGLLVAVETVDRER